MALIKLIDNITSALDNKEIVLGVYLDFSEAFDTVNFNILFKKLEKYGIRGIALQLFKSYLSQRQQYTFFNNAESSKECITCGVPQGSILGPILFLLYVNDIVNVSKAFFPLLFADDTNIFVNGTCTDSLISTMNIELNHLYTWLKANRLSLNVNKTHYMIFKTKNKGIPRPLSPLMINGEMITEVTHTKFLGVVIDSNLNWNQHICHVEKKIAKGCAIIMKVRKFLCRKTLISLYYSFVYPYINYCIEVSGTQNIY
jgi:hypothetical protein